MSKAKIYTLPVVQKARAKAAKPPPVPYQWLCKRCEHDIGIATSMVIQMRLSPRIKGLRMEGGTKQWICGYCWQRNVTTIVL